jgi:hypothetical protein
LLPPRQSSMHTLGDALANAKVERRKARAISSHVSSDRRCSSSSPQGFSTSPRLSPVTVVNVDSRLPRVDPLEGTTQPVKFYRGEIVPAKVGLDDESQTSPPVMNQIGSAINVYTAKSKESSNSKVPIPRGSSDTCIVDAEMCNKGCHTVCMGSNKVASRPITGYHPPYDLISLFCRTGTVRK